MDGSETYINVKFATTGTSSPSRDGQTSIYSELNIGKGHPPTDEDDDPPIASGSGELPITAQTGGLSSICSELNDRKHDPLIAEDDDPSIGSEPEGMPTTAQTGAHDQESKLKIGNRLHCLICLLCLVTSALIVTVTALSIHVSQIRQSKITLDRNYHELNSTLQSKVNEMETEYKSVNETKTKICELLTSSREQPCSDEWITNKDRCYYVSTFEKSFHWALQECSKLDSRLLEIDSRDEAKFVFHKLVQRSRAYWIGKCEDGYVNWGLLYKVRSATPACSQCETSGWNYPCDRDRRFICEKSAPFFPDIPEKIQELCRQPLDAP